MRANKLRAQKHFRAWPLWDQPVSGVRPQQLQHLLAPLHPRPPARDQAVELAETDLHARAGAGIREDNPAKSACDMLAMGRPR
jgi:hypothetical protein